MGRRLPRLPRELRRALGLTGTSTRIIDALARSQRWLSVKDLAKRLRVSERSVRGNLRDLLHRGILDRQAVVTTTRRLAYLYTLKPPHELAAAVQAHLAASLRRVQGALRGVSPRTSSSSRS